MNKEFIIKKAESCGIDFKIEDENKLPVELLLEYFSNNPEFEKKGYSLKKGIMLYGKLGVGKSTLMRLLARNDKLNYNSVNCREISLGYEKDGVNSIWQYIEKESNRSMGYCFDDLGVESDKPNYGIMANVMADVLLLRYEHGAPFYRTHVATNLTADQLKARYGDRLFSRFKEMFNVISFPKEATDRRA